MAYLSNHEKITNAIGRSLTGITSESSMTDIFRSLQNKGEIEMVPGTARECVGLEQEGACVVVNPRREA